MKISQEDVILIENLYLSKQYDARRLLRELRSMLTRDKNGIVCRAGKSVIQMLLRGHQMTASQACSCCRENARRSA